MNLGNETETFEERHRYFFQNCCYRFEGLNPTTRLAFERIIVRLSGMIDRHSKYCLTEKSYFERQDNKNRDDLYSIIYIEDCLNACDILDIEPYRFLTNKNVQDCQCSIAKHILRADSCEIYYHNNICCPSCDDLRSISDGYKNNLSISATDIPNIYQDRKRKDEDLLNLLSEKKKKYEISSNFLRTHNQTHDYSSSEYDSYDEAFDTCYSSRDSELNEDNILKSIEILSRDKSVSNENQEAEKDAAKSIENNITDSETSSRKESGTNLVQDTMDTDSENSSSNDADSQTSSKKESGTNLAQNTMDTRSEDSSSNKSTPKIRKLMNKTKRTISIVDVDSDEFVVKKCKTLQKPISSCKDSCITLESDNDEPVPNQQLEAQQRPSCSQNNNVVMGNPSNGKSQLNKGPKKFQSARSSENKDVQQKDEWWRQLPKRDENPYFEERHRTDKDRRRGVTFSREEQRYMIAYLVVTDNIANGKRRIPWKHMLIDGYMRNRSVESLSNNFRKIILPKIDEFGLPLQIRRKFHRLL